MSNPCHIYVYYKLNESAQADARGPAFDVLAAGKPWCDRTSLQRRTDAREGVATWMETYENVWDLGALEHALQEAAQRSGLLALLASPRHAERFEDVPVSLHFGPIE